MTENEAIERIKSGICNEIGTAKYCHDNCMHGVEHCAYSMAINALEEIQAYQAIGTVKDIQQKLRNMGLVMATDKDLLDRYREIGTVEEFKALKEKNEHYSETNELDGYGYGCTNKTCVERIRNKAIDKFTKEIISEYANDACPIVTDYLD